MTDATGSYGNAARGIDAKVRCFLDLDMKLKRN